MASNHYVMQPLLPYVSLFQRALGSCSVTHLDAAVAYATPGGVKKLREAFDAVSPTKWTEITKRWLVSIDYCRTNPYAIEVLLRDSEVKIFDGANVVGRTLCNPQLPFHPKAFILRNNANHVAIIHGSGNLSRNGMTQGHEVGLLATSSNNGQIPSANFISECVRIQAWFDDLWSSASPAADILDRYRTVYKSRAHVKNPTPTEDDETPPARSYRKLKRDGTYRTVYVSSPDPVMVRKLRTADQFWIIAGNSGNRPGLPGTQINMTPYSRVFFDFPAECVGINTEIGKISIFHDGVEFSDITIRFSDNCMDVITLPLPDVLGVDRYELQPILFKRLGDKRFEVKIGSARDVSRWTKISTESDSFYKMKGKTTYNNVSVQRTWGVF